MCHRYDPLAIFILTRTGCGCVLGTIPVVKAYTMVTVSLEHCNAHLIIATIFVFYCIWGILIGSNLPHSKPSRKSLERVHNEGG